MDIDRLQAYSAVSDGEAANRGSARLLHGGVNVGRAGSHYTIRIVEGEDLPVGETVESHVGCPDLTEPNAVAPALSVEKEIRAVGSDLYGGGIQMGV